VDATPREPAAAGHRVLPETSDVMLEAWGPTRETCMAQAVGALVACFADVTVATSTRVVPFTVAAGTDERQLLDILDECLSVFEMFEIVPVDTQVERADDGSLACSFDAAEAGRVHLLAGPPRGVRLHELEFEKTDGWHCLVGVDVQQSPAEASR
jgi:SHS2 domain-containing protein